MAISNNNTGIRTGVCTSTTRPTAPYEGQHIYETDTDIEYVWNGSAWVVNYVSAASPAFTGTPTAPTATAGTNTTQLATTAFANTAGGLVFVKSQTIGTAVSSVTVSDAFSSTYDSYRIVINNPTGSVADGLRFQLSGITTGVYFGNWTYALYNASALNVNPNNAGTNMTIGLTDTAALCFSIFDIVNPNTTGLKSFTGNYFGRGYAGTFGCFANSSVQSTGFIISNSSGTLTGGTITVYGYRKG